MRKVNSGSVFNFVNLVLGILLMGIVSRIANIPETANAQAPDKTIFHSRTAPRKVLLNRDRTLWVLPSRSSVVQKYTVEGRITEGFDVSAMKDLPSDTLTTIHDIVLGPEKDLYMIVGTIHPKTHEIGSYFIQVGQDRSRVVKLDIPIAAFKAGVDQEGNLYVLGLDGRSFDRIENEREKGQYRIVHEFSRDGEYISSFLPVELDPTTTETHMATIASPLHHPGNFAVTGGGEMWVVWFLFPPPTDGSGLSSVVYHVAADGEFKTVKFPEYSECVLEGVFVKEDDLEAAFSWGCPREGETVVTSSGGDPLYQAKHAGQVLAMSGDTLICGGVGLTGRFTVSALQEE